MSAISGTSTIAERPGLQRSLDRVQVDLGLARAGHAVQQEARARRRRRRRSRGAAAPARAADRRSAAGACTAALPSGRATGAAGARGDSIRTSPRASQAPQAPGPELGGGRRAAERKRLELAALALGEAGGGVGQRRPARLPSTRRRARGVRPMPAAGAGGEHQAERAGGRRAVLVRHPARPAPPSRPAARPPSTCSGSASRSGSSSELSASSTTTPSGRWPPNGTRSTDPTATR